MVQINDHDTPIEAASKLINGTRTVTPSKMLQAVRVLYVGKEAAKEPFEEDMFDLEDLREIADHLYAYVRAQEEKNDTD